MQATTGRLPPGQVIACGALVLMLTLGMRHGFGLWLQPIAMDRGWGRETFSMAMALQNLVWGLAGPLVGMAADRLGAFRVLLVGAVLYSGGLALMAVATNGTVFTVGSGLLIGVAQAATTFAVVYGVIGRNVPPQNRSTALGLVAAVASFGQFLMVPVENWLIAAFGWQGALWTLAALVLLVAPLSTGLREAPAASGAAASSQSIPAALREAFGHRSFLLLMAGYFTCGFQVVFIGVHLPSYLADKGLSPGVASTALALIGLFNIFGTYGAGRLGERWPKPYLLAAIYAMRAVAIAAFVLLPLSPATVYAFSILMGLLWLSTVPLTSAVVAQIFGVQYMAMLGGFVFLSHQIGSFLGGWLGGRLFDMTGSYSVVWWLAAALGVFAALINLPVRETPVDRGLQPVSA
ncbi:MAG: MFS transporter [Aquabacterium sp.]